MPDRPLGSRRRGLKGSQRLSRISVRDSDCVLSQIKTGHIRTRKYQLKKKGPIRWTPHSRGVLLQSSERRPVPLMTHPISVEAIADQAGANLAADTIRVNKLSVVQRRRQAQMIQKNSLRQTRSKNRTRKHWREN